MRKIITFFLLALLPSLAFVLASPAYGAIALAQPSATATVDGTSATVSLSSVGNHDLVLLWVMDYESTAPTVTESNSETINNAIPYGGSTSYIGLYYVENTAGGTVSFTVTLSTSGPLTIMEADYSGAAQSGALDAASAIATASSSTFTTASITPAESGELIVAGLTSGGNTGATWNSPFAAQQNDIGQAHASYADEIGTTGAVAASGTLSFSVQYAVAEAAFKAASTGSSCTHGGWAKNGSISVPNGTSGYYWSPTGNWVTPNCVDIKYWAPKVGNFVVN